MTWQICFLCSFYQFNLRITNALIIIMLLVQYSSIPLSKTFDEICINLMTWKQYHIYYGNIFEYKNDNYMQIISYHVCPMRLTVNFDCSERQLPWARFYPTEENMNTEYNAHTIKIYSNVKVKKSFNTNLQQNGALNIESIYRIQN